LVTVDMIFPSGLGFCCSASLRISGFDPYKGFPSSKVSDFFQTSIVEWRKLEATLTPTRFRCPSAFRNFAMPSKMKRHVPGDSDFGPGMKSGFSMPVMGHFAPSINQLAVGSENDQDLSIQ
jgi:hypothetical protein